MKILKGKYNEAIVFTNNVDNDALEQINNYLNNPLSANTKIRVMPDVHVGYDVPIGFTQTISETIIPNFVGVDIGCGMLVTKLANQQNMAINYQKLDKVIKEVVPSGFKVFNVQQELNLNLKDLIATFNLDRALKSVGTLGGGNHFIELNSGSSGIYLVIHSGSRHLGVEVNKYWHQIAMSKGYLDGKNFEGYLADMKITQKFASLNRKRIRDNIFKAMNYKILEEFESVHNYIDLEQMILRKGATSAKLNEKLLIPINMRDGSILAKGLGNANWNYSAPHGAGRIMSRSVARKNISLERFKSTMVDVYSTSVSEKTIDESPFVYKDLEEIIDNTKDTIIVIDRLKTLYNFKA